MEKGINALTGLYFDHKFFEKADEFLLTVDREKYCMLAVDLEHFRLYNKIHGKENGDLLLKTVADILLEFRVHHGGIVGYLGGDNFGVLTTFDRAAMDELRLDIENEIHTRNNTMGYRPAIGIYHITGDMETSGVMYDHATVALSHVIGNYVTRTCEYVEDMDRKIEEEIRLLSDIQVGMDQDEFTFFIQPQCDITNSKIVGGESLVRWIRTDKGMVPPGVFIPVLEKNGFIADLDRIIWEKVCCWLRDCLDKGLRPVPISINVSQIDIFSMDVPTYLWELIEKYELDPQLLKVEITESAYSENENVIIQTVTSLQKKGFIVMMDDFGSGYSSLNMLKSVPVDVLKMDMRFLEISENEEEKGVGILESVVNMARQMKVPIVVEGVEFKKHEQLLQRMGCSYTQGYYYYKPMSIADFEELISDVQNIDYGGFWCKQSESLHMREFMDSNLFSDTTINSILGAMAFYDMYENTIEIARVNHQYMALAGIGRENHDEHRKLFWNHVRSDDRQLLFSIFNEAYEKQGEGVTGYIHYVRNDSTTIWVQMRVFFLREKGGHKHFCALLSDMTELKDKKRDVASVNFELDDLTEKQKKQLEVSYGDFPCGFGIGKLKLAEDGTPLDYEIVYANKILSALSGGDGFRLRFLMSKLFADKMDELLENTYRAAYLGETIKTHVYSNLSGRYLDLAIYQYQYGYAGCVIQDITHSQIYANSLNNIMSSFREVYFLHLQDNYCRMIYPDENHLLDRGIYEEVVNRHFEEGRILPQDEENIRRFLSLENLRRELAKKDSIEFKYRRRLEPAGSEWCMTTIMVSERVNGVPKTATITIRSIEALMREQSDERYHNMAQMLAHMSDGFFVYRATDDERILYANPPVLQLFECDLMDEFRELVDDSFTGMVHPDDRKRVQFEIEEQIKHSDRKVDFICYRIITRKGNIRWVEDCGHLEDSGSSEDTKLFYVFIADITGSMTEERIRRIDRLNEQYNK